MGSRQIVSLEDTSVFLYANGLAQVTAEAQIKPSEDGSAQVTLQGVPLEVLVETVHAVDPQVRLTSMNVRPPQTYNDLLDSLVGTIVEDQRSKEEVVVNAVVWNNSESTPVFLVTSTSKDSTYLLPLALAGCTFLKDAVVTKPRLDATVTGLSTAETTTPMVVPFCYMVTDVNANIHYNLVLTKDGLVLTGLAKFTNDTGKQYENVEVTLIPGDVTTPLRPRDALRMRGAAGAAPHMRRLVASSGVTPEEVDEQLRYTMDNTNIPTGTSTKELFTSHQTGYKLVNKVDVTPGRDQDHRVSTRLEFKAPGLLPKGSVGVYSRTTDEHGQITEEYQGGGAIYAPTLEDEEVSILLRTPDTLQVKVKAKKPSYEKLPDKGVYVKRVTYTATFTNDGKAPTTLDASLHLSEFQKLEAPSLEPIVDEKTREWNVTLNPGEKQTLTYTLAKELYRALDRKEVEELKKEDQRQ